jgi:hypothetical protein
MPESGTFGSVRGVPGNGYSYRDSVPNRLKPVSALKKAAKTQVQLQFLG